MADDEVAVRLLWIGLDEKPVEFVNQFIGQSVQGEIFVSLGTVTPPVILGQTLEERRAQAEGLGYVPVRPVARLALTRRGLSELIKVLQDTETIYETQQGGGS